jgi:hypothetical protein
MSDTGVVGAADVDPEDLCPAERVPLAVESDRRDVCDGWLVAVGLGCPLLDLG